MPSVILEETLSERPTRALAQADRAIVKRFRSLLRKREIPFLEIIVYGSRARGEASPDSDLDVLVIMESFDQTMRERISDCGWEAGLESGVFVQTVVMTRDEAINSPQRSSLFMIGIREDGVCV